MYRQLDDAAQDIELVVCELVTNAVRADTDYLLLAVDVHHSRVRVAVSDDAPGIPILQHPAVDAAGGRGLQIVSSLALRWGLLPEAGRKTVWADLPVPGSAGASFACTDPGAAAGELVLAT